MELLLFLPTNPPPVTPNLASLEEDQSSSKQEAHISSNIIALVSPTKTSVVSPFPVDVSTGYPMKTRFEKDKEKKLLAHTRAVLRKESQIAEHSRKILEIEAKLREETHKLKATDAESSNLRRVRQASVALNVWQPEVVRGRQKDIVEQCVVSVESRLHALDMELRLCNQQIAGFCKAYREQKQRLDKAKEELRNMKYHPLREYKLTGSEEDECNRKRKKLKICINCKSLSSCSLHIKQYIHLF
ncbi:hypothetical protein EZV62_007726 [Acer yangbiense]|uniref:Uncharacterized protein n=1 Tax=Acer yangbiense TaxID=1000413 RepID=A0A5C7IBG6_9ROSI|nr:hypothetical protein EZV62_007726 [Acer yangbiense]